MYIACLECRSSSLLYWSSVPPPALIVSCSLYRLSSRFSLKPSNMCPCLKFWKASREIIELRACRVPAGLRSRRVPTCVCVRPSSNPLQISRPARRPTVCSALGASLSAAEERAAPRGLAVGLTAGATGAAGRPTPQAARVCSLGPRPGRRHHGGGLDRPEHPVQPELDLQLHSAAGASSVPGHSPGGCALRASLCGLRPPPGWRPWRLAV